jgi:hypothetical protein
MDSVRKTTGLSFEGKFSIRYPQRKGPKPQGRVAEIELSV